MGIMWQSAEVGGEHKRHNSRDLIAIMGLMREQTHVSE